MGLSCVARVTVEGVVTVWVKLWHSIIHPSHAFGRFVEDGVLVEYCECGKVFR
jgi:hypothetical protein